ncbi:glycosyltransferase family 2 protein [Desulfobacterota bacterium AH_259_B03_O07]|nr:glycosyltransferase family 2 protein [Desulfobacterota bacterium AH_259_B03_O07]
MNNKILVIIPAFNEADSILSVINDIPKDMIDEIVVVNNGSSDGTEVIARNAGATVIKEDRRGYGYACLKGIEYAMSKPDSVKPNIVVFLDGDYSDYPQEMVELITPILEHDYDLVIGSRTLGKMESGAMLPQAVFGNFLATRLIKWFYGVTFTDLGPFRAIKFDKLLSLNMEDKTFGWTAEMQVKAAKIGLKYIEVPVSYRKRVGVSKITGTLSGTINAGYKILWTIFRHL